MSSKLMAETMFTDRKYVVKYLLNLRNGINEKRHALYGGLSTNASIGIPAPINTDRHITVRDIFSKEELEILAETLHDDRVKDFNSSFWQDNKKDSSGSTVSRFPILLKKEGKILNTKDPIDYIYVKILQNCPMIATNDEDARDVDTYRFLLIDQSNIWKSEINTISDKKRAYIELGKVESNIPILIYLLKMFNKKVDYNSIGRKEYKDFLVVEVSKLAELKPSKFVEILSDKFLDTKVKLINFSKVGLVTEKDGFFYDPSDGTPLKLNGDPSNDLEGASRYLESNVGQEFKLKCIAEYNKMNKEANTKK